MNFDSKSDREWVNDGTEVLPNLAQ